MWADRCLTDSRVSTIWYNIQKFWQFHHCSCVWYQVMSKLLNTNSDFTFSPASLPHHSAAAPNLEERHLQVILCFSKSSEEGVLLPHLITNLPRRNRVWNLRYKQQPFIPLAMELKRTEIKLFKCISSRLDMKELTISALQFERNSRYSLYKMGLTDEMM